MTEEKHVGMGRGGPRGTLKRGENKGAIGDGCHQALVSPLEGSGEPVKTSSDGLRACGVRKVFAYYRCEMRILILLKLRKRKLRHSLCNFREQGGHELQY